MDEVKTVRFDFRVISMWAGNIDSLTSVQAIEGTKFEQVHFQYRWLT
jgi:hypothetical protein